MAYRYTLPSDEHLKAIGLVTAQWERLRSIIDAGIRALMSKQHEGEGEAIISYMDLRCRLDLLQKRFHKDNSNARTSEKLRDICNRVYDLRSERNEVVHGLWILGDFDTTDMITLRPSDGEPIKKASQKTISSHSVAADIAEEADRLVRFLSDHDVTTIDMEPYDYRMKRAPPSRTP